MSMFPVVYFSLVLIFMLLGVKVEVRGEGIAVEAPNNVGFLERTKTLLS